MRVTVNGEPKTLDRELNVGELLAQLGLTPQRVAVEVNEQLVRRAVYAQTPVREGDRIEIVTLIGGG